MTTLTTPAEAARLARKLGFVQVDDTGTRWAVDSTRIAALIDEVRGLEREACAEEADYWQQLTERRGGHNKDGAYIAAAIRGRACLPRGE